VVLDYVLALLWGCHLLGKLGSAKHHPQKRHIPRQAGLCVGSLSGAKVLSLAINAQNCKKSAIFASRFSDVLFFYYLSHHYYFIVWHQKLNYS
jgi:hypothetical protein